MSEIEDRRKGYRALEEERDCLRDSNAELVSALKWAKHQTSKGDVPWQDIIANIDSVLANNNLKLRAALAKAKAGEGITGTDTITLSTERAASFSFFKELLGAAEEIARLHTAKITANIDSVLANNNLKLRAALKEVAGADVVALDTENTRLRAENVELMGVVRSAAGAWEQLQKMYNGQDREQREAGEVGSVHRDNFEAFLDGLTEDARAALAKARGEEK